jgi:hypothetical protein
MTILKIPKEETPNRNLSLISKTSGLLKRNFKA